MCEGLGDVRVVCMSTFVSVRSVRAYVGVNVRVNVFVCQCVALCLSRLSLSR